MEKLEKIVALLREAREGLERAFAMVPPERWQASARPGGWSAAHVAAHLEMVERTILGGAQRHLAGPPTPTPLLKRLHFPVAVVQWRWPRARTPIPVDEALLAEQEAMLARLRAVRQRTCHFLKGVAGRDLRLYRWPHPFLGSFNFYDWFKLIALHERRHTKQIREMVQIFQR